MGKKFVTLVTQSKKYRLYPEDIKNIFQKQIRKVPAVPRFEKDNHYYDEETYESCLNLEDTHQVEQLL